MKVIFITNVDVIRSNGEDGKIMASFEAIAEQDLPVVPSKETIIAIGDMYGAVHEVWYDVKKREFSIIIGDDNADPDLDPGILRFADWSLKAATAHMKKNGFRIGKVNIRIPEPKKTKKAKAEVDSRGISQTEGWANVIRNMGKHR